VIFVFFVALTFVSFVACHMDRPRFSNSVEEAVRVRENPPTRRMLQ